MRDEKHEGIVLRSLDFKDREKIITVFTPTKGLISLIVKGITKKKSHLLTLTSPFTRAEYHFSIGKSELYRFKDGSPLATHHSIRKSLLHIESGTAILQSLLASQLPEKKAPALYKLTLTYLTHLPDFEEPTTLSASFLLKLLFHDGHLSLSSNCSLCEHPPSRLYEGEPYCQHHAPAHLHVFTPREWEILTVLANARSLSQLTEARVTLQLHEKIKRVFEEKK